MQRRWVAGRARGLTMLEMIIAVTMFSTVVVAMMGVWAMHARAVANARNTLLASHLAGSVMETMLAQGWQVRSIAPTASTRLDMTSVINNERVVVTFQYGATVTHLPGSGGLGLKEVRVFVKWTEPDGRKREVDLETVVYWQG